MKLLSFLSEVKYRGHGSSLSCHTAMATHILTHHMESQCYLPPGKGDSPFLTRGKLVLNLAATGGMQG